MDISIYIIIIAVSIVYIIYNTTHDRFTSSIEKQKEYITVGALAGLNNRIQVILSYLYLARLSNKKLKVIWIVDEQCPDRFDTLFHPIKDIEIIYDPIDEALYDYKNWDKQNNDYIKAKYYSLLKPIVNIKIKIDDIKQLLSYNSKNYIACHIRRTDALTHEWYKRYVKTDEEYIKFINNCPYNYKIYIATDCKLTQEKFIKLYGDRIIYKDIPVTTELRQTSLEDAVKDMWVCAGAKYFMRSHGSFSDTIDNIRNLTIENYEENYKIDGDYMYQQAYDSTNYEMQNAEHSRFNYKTKECGSWYCLETVSNILSQKIKYKNILVLGVALGAQIIHLLNKDPNIRITGVDLSDINFDIVKKYSDKNRLRLIKEDANNYIMNTDDTYDVIICDIFIGKNIGDFILTEPFLNKINKMLPNINNKFILNTTTETDKDHALMLLNNSFENYDIQLINNPMYVNNLYFLTKN
jgi:hypothetical protein